MNERRVATLRLARAGLALGGAALALAGCKSVGATGGCAALGDCGGDPTGVWQVAAICSYPAVSRPAQNYDSTRGYFQPETGAPSPAVTSGGWCWDLSFDSMGNVKTPTAPLPYPDVVQSGTVTFNADHTYTYTLTATSVTPFHIARSCLGANGQGTSCADLGNKIGVAINAENPVYSNLSNTGPGVECQDAGDGCDCTFDYIETDQNAVGDKGTWAVDPGGNVIHHYSIAGQGNLYETNPSRRTARDATFCVTDGGNTLELSGANGQLLALKAGLRTLTLSKVVVPDAATDDTGAAGAGVTGAAGAGGDTGGAAGDMGGAAGGDGTDAGADADAGAEAI
jgi:hypothetical protein